MNKKLPMLILPLSIFMLTGTVSAQIASSSATIDLQQYRIREVVQKDGKVLEMAELAPKTLIPGDVVEERITVKNPTAKDIRVAGVRFPVNGGLTFSSVGKSGYQVEYSIDKGKTFSFRPMIVKVVDGIRKDIAASPSSYNVVRWDMRSLPAGTEKIFTVRFTVNK